ncbi:MAG: hypothetical protein ACLS7Z_09970 [Christensenellales bacterium]
MRGGSNTPKCAFDEDTPVYEVPTSNQGDCCLPRRAREIVGYNGNGGGLGRNGFIP